jgi:AraC-like DNA-binding protein
MNKHKVVHNCFMEKPTRSFDLPPGSATPVAFDVHSKLFSPTKILVAKMVAHEGGLTEAQLFEGTGLDALQLADAETLTSIDQYLTVVRNLLKHYPGDDAGIRIGKLLHLSHYGMYGYAVLCASTYRQSCEIVVKYDMVGTPVLSTWAVERQEHFSWIFGPMAATTPAALGPKMFRTLLEAQFLIHIVGTIEVMGPKCIPLKARMSISAPVYAEELARAFQCDIEFDQPLDEIIYDSAWLDCAPRMASSIMCEKACKALSRQLDELTWTAGIAGLVYEELTRVPSEFPTMEAVAKQLCMTSRNLRRRLEAEGTSYQKLLTSVQKSLAIEYVTSSDFSAEEVATKLGFSDAPSFRNAFRRWTGKTPKQFRSTI